MLPLSVNGSSRSERETFHEDIRKVEVLLYFRLYLTALSDVINPDINLHHLLYDLLYFVYFQFVYHALFMYYTY